MVSAFFAEDPSYAGVFIVAVKTTGIFCRIGCPARKPKAENVDFYPRPQEAVLAGYRPCKRCRPLEPAGVGPVWLPDLLAALDADPARRWKDQDLRALGLSPEQVRRWFRKHHGMTFHQYERSRRLGAALGHMRGGGRVTDAALEHGYDSLSGFNDAFRKLFGAAPTKRSDLTCVTMTRLVTELGPMLAGATDEGLCLLEFVDRRMLETQIERVRQRLRCQFIPGTHPMLVQTARELDEYFNGSRRAFSVPLVTPGTEFQQLVWKYLEQIPSGKTTSYSALAKTIGRPKATRAVARANGDNRIAIMIPCHRVIGADGSLTGYGGGLWRKRRLLELEQQ